MPDHEFENYLTLISRFLRLSPAQREAIGAELRDHFESRLTELINTGKSHDEAVRLALAEFGDAAGLAAEFSHISQARRRRLVMRCTVASVAALAAAVFVAMAVWPDHHGRVVKDAMADNAAKSPEKTAAEPIPTEESLTAETEAKLEQFVKVDVAEQPLSEYFTELSDRLHIPIQFDTSALRDATIDPSTTPVGFQFAHVRVRTLLNLMLGQHGMGYVVRDGILIVSTNDKLNTMLVTRIYDCRDILAADRPENRPWDVAKPVAKSDDHGVKNENTETLNVKTTTPNPTIIKHYFSGTPSERLINVITTVIAAPSWDDVGGQGTIQEYNGLLVVSQTAEVQADVARVLEQIAGKLAATAKK
jgi:hypothetical protein